MFTLKNWNKKGIWSIHTTKVYLSSKRISQISFRSFQSLFDSQEIRLFIKPEKNIDNIRSILLFYLWNYPCFLGVWNRAYSRGQGDDITYIWQTAKSFQVISINTNFPPFVRNRMLITFYWIFCCCLFLIKI